MKSALKVRGQYDEFALFKPRQPEHIEWAQRKLHSTAPAGSGANFIGLGGKFAVLMLRMDAADIALAAAMAQGSTDRVR